MTMSNTKNIDFDPSTYYDEHLVTVRICKHLELEFLSRLLTAMVENGAIDEDISNITKYSMVVINAQKKHLNWKRAANDFHVAEIAKKYLDEKEKKT